MSVCRRCGNSRLYRAKSRWYHRFARLVLLYAVRCNRCQSHFWRLGVHPPPDGRVKVKTKIKKKVVRRARSSSAAPVVPDVAAS